MDNAYIDDATQEMAYDKVLNLFTEKDYRGFRTEDMAEVHNRIPYFTNRHRTMRCFMAWNKE